MSHKIPQSTLPVKVKPAFAAWAALGRRLYWWIISRDHVIQLRWVGPNNLQYGWVQTAPQACRWFDGLRQLSYDNPSPPGVSP